MKTRPRRIPATDFSLRALLRYGGNAAYSARKE
jgi:hypothetical protein